MTRLFTAISLLLFVMSLAWVSCVSTEAPKPSAPPAKIESQVSDANRPNVASVYPSDGAVDVDPETEIRIQYDQEMDPLSARLEWIPEKPDQFQGGFLECGSFRYVADKKEFVMQVRLKPGQRHGLTANLRGEDFGGFQSTKGVVAKRFEWSFTTKALPQVEGIKPQVVSIMPPWGTEVALRTLITIKFDRPMNSKWCELVDLSVEQFPMNVANICMDIEYDPAQYQFTIPVGLPQNWNGRFELRGFRSTEGVEADPIQLKYATEKEALSPDLLRRIEQGAKSSELRSVLEKVKQARENLTSLSERVQTINYSRYRTGAFSSLWTWWGDFKMQGDRQFFTNVTNIMRIPFYIGSDGKECWFYRSSKTDSQLTTCPFDAVDEKNVLICEPFEISNSSVDEAIERLKLEYLGTAALDNHVCHVICSWSGMKRALGSFAQVWIDGKTYLPVQLVQGGGTIRAVSRYTYDRINQPIPDSEFSPNSVTSLSPTGLEPLGEGYDKRYLNVVDGSNGRMTVRWGKKGSAGGMSSSGLN